MRWPRAAVVTGILALAVGIVAGSWALLAYNAVTKIDRSNPKVVTDEFLRATLIRKDGPGADLYACREQRGLDSIKSLRMELDKRERDYEVAIVISWGAYVSISNDLATDITITAYSGGIEESSNVERWRFGLVDDDGWRVCTASKV